MNIHINCFIDLVKNWSVITFRSAHPSAMTWNIYRSHCLAFRARGRQYRVKGARNTRVILGFFAGKPAVLGLVSQPIEVRGARPHESYLRAAGTAFPIFTPSPFLHKALAVPPDRSPFSPPSTSIGFPVSFHQVDPDFRRLRLRPHIRTRLRR